MKLTKDCKIVLDTIIENKPDLQDRFYTRDFILNQPAVRHMDVNVYLATLDRLVELRTIEYADNLHTVLRVKGNGMFYKEIQALETKEKWKERIWGFVCGVLTGIALAYFT